MKTFVRIMAGTVRRAPVLVILAAIAATAWFASYIPDRQQATVVDAFAPDSPEFLAFERIGDDFGGVGTTLQVVMTAPGGDVITRRGLDTQVAIERTVAASAAAEYLDATAPNGPVVGPFTPVVVGAEMMGVSLDLLADDAAVKEAFGLALDAAGPEVTADIGQLLSRTGTDPAAATAPAGLVLVEFVFPDALTVDDVDELLIALEGDLIALGSDQVEVQVYAAQLLNANEAIRGQINTLMIQAALIIVVILGFVLWVGSGEAMSRRAALRRTAADVAIAAVTTGMALVWVFGAEAAFGPDHLGLVGYSSSITQIVPVLLIGLGVDYAIHLTSRYREELADGHSARPASSRAIGAVGVALVLGAVTTAVGFLTNLANPVPTLQDFGILAAFGIGGAFLLMVTFAPSVRLLLDRRAERRGESISAEMRTHGGGIAGWLAAAGSRPAEAIPTVVVGAALVAAVLGGYGLSRLDTSFSLVDFVPDGTQSLEARRTLLDEFRGGLGETTYVVVDGDVATVEAHNALVAALDRAGSLRDVVVSGGSIEAESPVSVIAALLDQDPGFASDAAGAGLAGDLRFEPGGDPDAVYAAAARLAPEAMEGVFASDAGGSALARITTRGGEERAVELRAGLEGAFAPLDALEGIAIQVTSEQIITEEVKASLSNSQTVSLVITLGAAMALLVAGFWWEARRPFLGVITILPVALVVLWTYGMMTLTGIPFSPSTAMVAALAIGIGVDYTIHIVRRYLEDRSRLGSIREAIRSTARSTGGALTGSALTTLAGFGILVTSTLGPFRDLGAVVVFAIGFSLFAAVVVLPAMLVLWDRWHAGRGRSAVGGVRGSVTAVHDTA